VLVVETIVVADVVVGVGFNPADFDALVHPVLATTATSTTSLAILRPLTGQALQNSP
jgi:hypothetical protein